MSDSIPAHVKKRLRSASIFLAGSIALVGFGLYMKDWDPEAAPGPSPDAVPEVMAHAPGQGPVPPFPLEAERHDEAARTVVRDGFTTHELRYRSDKSVAELEALYADKATLAEGPDGVFVVLKWTPEAE